MSNFKPFEVGTVRGPYTCGKGSDPKGGVQYLVRTKGGWVAFILAAKERNEAERLAKEFAAKQTSEL